MKLRAGQTAYVVSWHKGKDIHILGRFTVTGRVTGKRVPIGRVKYPGIKAWNCVLHKDILTQPYHAKFFKSRRKAESFLKLLQQGTRLPRNTFTRRAYD